ncbi:MAG: RidA family protein [Erythrobacter sp.]
MRAIRLAVGLIAAATVSMPSSMPANAEGQSAQGEPEYRALEGSDFPLSEAVQVGDILYLSGKLGTAADGSGLVPGGIEPQARRAMDRIGETLAKYDLTHDAVFKCTVWLADMKDFDAFNAVYKSYFKPGRYPARSAMAVKGLALGAAVEVECVAHTGMG